MIGNRTPFRWRRKTHQNPATPDLGGQDPSNGRIMSVKNISFSSFVQWTRVGPMTHKTVVPRVRQPLWGRKVGSSMADEKKVVLAKSKRAPKASKNAQEAALVGETKECVSFLDFVVAPTERRFEFGNVAFEAEEPKKQPGESEAAEYTTLKGVAEATLTFVRGKNAPRLEINVGGEKVLFFSNSNAGHVVPGKDGREAEEETYDNPEDVTICVLGGVIRQLRKFRATVIKAIEESIKSYVATSAPAKPTTPPAASPAAPVVAPAQAEPTTEAPKDAVPAGTTASAPASRRIGKKATTQPAASPAAPVATVASPANTAPVVPPTAPAVVEKAAPAPKPASNGATKFQCGKCGKPVPSEYMEKNRDKWLIKGGPIPCPHCDPVTPAKPKRDPRFRKDGTPRTPRKSRAKKLENTGDATTTTGSTDSGIAQAPEAKAS